MTNEPSLFLAYPVDNQLDKASCFAKDFFLSGGDYLEEMWHDGRKYLGKALPSYLKLEELGLAERHLLSLLRKLRPEATFKRENLILIHGTVDCRARGSGAAAR